MLGKELQQKNHFVNTSRCVWGHALFYTNTERVSAFHSTAVFTAQL